MTHTAPGDGGLVSRIRSWGPWLAAAAVALVVLGIGIVPVLRALLVPGIVATRAAGDSPFLLQRVHEYAAAIAGGEIPPRWMPGAAYGLGYPFFNYYAPLAYALAAVVALAGGGVVGGIKIVQLGAFVAAAAGMYLAARTLWGSRAPGVVAAAAYTFAPYHLVNLYVRGDALAELVAYAAFPWLLFAFERAFRRRTTSTVAFLALMFAALPLSHNISALLFAVVFAAYLMWRIGAAIVAAVRRDVADLGDPGDLEDRPTDSLWPAAVAQPAPGGRPTAPPAFNLAYVGSRGPELGRGPSGWLRRGIAGLERRTWRARPGPTARSVVAVGVGLALGLVLSGWFWIPALAERGAVQLDANRSGYFSFDAKDAQGEFLHFRGADLVDLHPVFDYAVTGGCTPCRDGLVQVLIALIGTIVALGAAWTARRGPSGSQERPGVVGVPGSPASTMSLTLFWLGVAIASTFMLTALSQPLWRGVPLLDFAQFPWRWLAPQAAALALLSGGIGLGRVRWIATTAAVLALGGAAILHLRVETLPVSNVTADDLATYELVTGNIGSTVRAEYLPNGVIPRPWSGPAAVSGGSGEPLGVGGSIGSATAAHRSAGESDWLVEVPGSITTTVAFPTLWYPGWTASVLPRTPTEPTAPMVLHTSAVRGLGWIGVDLPQGDWVVRLELGRTPVRAITEGAALVALLVVLALFLVDRRRVWWRYLVGGSVGALLILGLARALPVGASRGPITLDMGRTPYPHRNPGGISFGGAHLVRALIDRKLVSAGSSIGLSLEWSDPWAGTLVEADLVSPAEPVYHVPDIRARADANQGLSNKLSLEVPDDTASGLYLVRLSVTNNGKNIVATNAEGADLGTVYLGPVRVTGKAEFRDLPREPVARMGPATLHAVQASVSSDDPSKLEVRMFWEAAHAMPLNYKTSVRLIAANQPDSQDAVASEDKQPLYGFYPTSSWRQGEQVLDIRWLTLPVDLPDRDDYIVEVVLYDGDTMQVAGIGRVAGVSVRRPANLREQ